MMTSMLLILGGSAVIALCSFAFSVAMRQEHVGWMDHWSHPDEILVNISSYYRPRRGDIVKVFGEGWPTYRIKQVVGPGKACWHTKVRVVEIQPQAELTKRAISEARADLDRITRNEAAWLRR